MALNIPDRIPKIGFYYSDSHDPNGPVYNNSFFVSFIGFTSKNSGGNPYVVYWPLDKEAPVYKACKGVDLKTPEEWFREIEKDGKLISKYTLIEDTKVIYELHQIRISMYGM